MAMGQYWYYVDGDETRGPITFDQLIKFLSQLPTPGDVLVWREGFTDWTAAENVREIAEKLIRPPTLPRRSSAIPPPLPESAATPSPTTRKEKTGLLSGLKRKARMWRESFVAGTTDTGKVTATVRDQPVLNWHGTPTQRDEAIKLFPAIRDRLMPGTELGSFADAMIAHIYANGMSRDKDMVAYQTIAMLWRVFTTPFDEDVTYGDFIAHSNMHATFELHEQSNDEFNVTLKIDVVTGQKPN